MSYSISKVKVQPCKAIWNDVDFGLTQGDMEIKSKENSVDIMGHQEGSNILDSIRTGKHVEIGLTLIETSLDKLQTMLGIGGGDSVGVAQITSIACIADVSGSLNSKFFPLYARDGSKFLIYMNINSAGVAPVWPGYTAVAAAAATGATADAVADAVASAIDGLSQFTAPNPGAHTVLATDVTAGIVAAGTPSAGNTGFTVTVDTLGVSTLTGWGKTKDFTGMLGDSKKLFLHPVALDDADATQDIAFWKAYPILDSIKKSGEKEGDFKIAFKIFPDTTQDGAVRLFVVGDHT